MLLNIIKYYQKVSDIHQRMWGSNTNREDLMKVTKTKAVQSAADNALSDPYGTKKQYKGDEELTTDLIARNSPLDIKAEIKDLKDKQKKANEGERKAESNELQRNIDLLEKGLEKKTQRC